MIEVIMKQKRNDAIYSSDVPEDKPIFVKKYGWLCGMVVKEEGGWIVRTGGCCGAYGFWKTREDCMSKGNFTYHIVSRKESN